MRHSNSTRGIASRTLGALLAIAMSTTLAGAAAWADEAPATDPSAGEAPAATPETYSGECGEDLTWTLDPSTGVLSIEGTGEMSWPSSELAPWRQYGDLIRSVAISEGVTSIGEHAFDNCPAIASVDIPSTVKTIGYCAFFRCTSLESATIPDGVTAITSGAFSDCASLRSVTIPNSVTRIDWSAFSGCTSLKSVTIPSSVTDIEGQAFYGCTSLESVSLPDGITWIYPGTFQGCKSLRSVAVPEGVTEIGECAFSGCESLTSVDIPSSICEIGHYAFRGCKSLASVSIPEGVTYIGNQTFQGCMSLESVSIPSTVERIWPYAFAGCAFLRTVVIPEAAVLVGQEAFGDCTSLEYAELPSGLAAVPERLFRGCTSLAYVVIPDGVAAVGDGAFQGCSALLAATLPESLTYVGVDAFAGCTSLRDVYCAQPDRSHIGLDRGNDRLAWATWHFGTTEDPADAFARRLYSDILDRGADPEGLAVQVRALHSGWQPAEIAYNYFNSQEYFSEGEDAEATVERVYQVMFGRESDEDGKAFWVAKLEDGMSVRAVVQGFSQADEYRAYFGGQGLNASAIGLYSDTADKAWDSEGNLVYSGGNGRDLNQGAAAFARRMYTVVLGRDAEVGGLNAQAGAVAKGMPCWQIAVNFFGSDEFAGKGYSTSEAVAIAYEAILGRTGSEEEVGWWVGVAERDCYTVTDVVLHFCNSDEFNDICAGFGLTSGMRGRGAAALPVPRAHTWSGPQCVRCGASMPVHEHSWTYHEAVYEYRDVYVGEYVLCSCGAQFPTQAAWSAHNQSLGFGVSHSYSVKSIYDVQRVCVRDAYYSCECGETKGQGE